VAAAAVATARATTAVSRAICLATALSLEAGVAADTVVVVAAAVAAAAATTAANPATFPATAPSRVKEAAAAAEEDVRPPNATSAKDTAISLGIVLPNRIRSRASIRSFGGRRNVFRNLFRNVFRNVFRPPKCIPRKPETDRSDPRTALIRSGSAVATSSHIIRSFGSFVNSFVRSFISHSHAFQWSEHFHS